MCVIFTLGWPNVVVRGIDVSFECFGVNKPGGTQGGAMYDLNFVGICALALLESVLWLLE